MNKQEIKVSLASYVARYTSQNAAANSLTNVSAATVSQILNDKWEKIADEMWRNIASQVGVSNWVKVETRCYQLIHQTLADAQQYANTHAVTASAGSGKSYSAADYAATHPNAYHITCCEWWGPKSFFAEILRIMGLESRVVNNDNSAMIDTIVAALKRKEHPVVIFDEADKLQNKVLYGFISLYNQLEGSCGLVMMATDNLERKLKDGVRRNTAGYSEIYSRLGRRVIAIKGNSANDVVKLCQANGISDQDAIDKVISDCDMDLRRVKRFVHSYKMIKQNGTSN